VRLHAAGVFDARLAGEPTVQEVDGTTDSAAWVPVSALGDEPYRIRDVVRSALAARERIGFVGVVSPTPHQLVRARRVGRGPTS
jgi:hypothetical protein